MKWSGWPRKFSFGDRCKKGEPDFLEFPLKLLKESRTVPLRFRPCQRPKASVLRTVYSNGMIYSNTGRWQQAELPSAPFALTDA